MEKIVVNAEEVSAEVFPWGQIKWLHSGPFSGAEELTFGEVVINPGAENPFHSHSNCEEVLYLISGELEHTYGDSESYRLKPGMAICIPAGVKHNAKCVSAEPARMVIAFSSAYREVAGE